MSGNKFVHHWKTAIAVSLLAFASGTLVGVAGTLHYVSNHLPRFIDGPEKMPERIVAQLQRELELSDDQARRVLAIFEGGHDQLRAIRGEAQPRIETIMQTTFEEVSKTLKPEQQEAWRNWFDTMKRKFAPRGHEGGPELPPAP
jgi:hypothetical protein